MAKEIINNNIFFDYLVGVINSSIQSRVELPIKGVSMQPTLVEFRDRVVLTSLDENELFVGAIALFRYNGKYLLHRLIMIEGEWLIFRGDNLHASSERVHRDDVVAIVESIIKDEKRVISCVDNPYRHRVKRYLVILSLRNIYFRIKRHLAKFVGGLFKRRA